MTGPLDKNGRGGVPKIFFWPFGGSQFGLKIRGAPGPSPVSATGFIDPYDIFRPFPSQSEWLSLVRRVNKIVYLSVNVFNTGVWRRDRHFTWSSEPKIKPLQLYFHMVVLTFSLWMKSFGVMTIPMKPPWHTFDLVLFVFQHFLQSEIWVVFSCCCRRRCKKFKRHRTIR